jgi:hypothetical protein
MDLSRRTMAKGNNSPAAGRESTLPATPVVAMILAWILPGAGHLYLRRPRRAVSFFALVVVSFLVGSALHGKLFVMVPDQPLSRLGTLASMGAGLPYFLARFGLEYQGDIRSSGYEYGGAFLLTAGLMNLLLVLDVFDIARGYKD